MKISTKSRYALRLMLDLATYYNGEPVSIRDISKRQDVSDKYLEQIIPILSRAGFVKSIRGAQGGYRLAKKPSEYTVGMILRTTEAAFLTAEATESDDNTTDRLLQPIWEQMDKAVLSVVDNITLENLMEQQDAFVGQYCI